MRSNDHPNNRNAASPVRTGFRMAGLLLIALLVALDQGTKYLALSLKVSGPRVLLPGVLELRYLENRGAAFSMLQGQQSFFYLITAVFLLLVFLFFRKIPVTRRMRAMRLCLLFLTAGALGNLIDRLARRYVIDFIYFSLIDFPIFNVADIYVTLSVVFLVLLLLFYYKEEDLSFLKKEEREEDHRR